MSENNTFTYNGPSRYGVRDNVKIMEVDPSVDAIKSYASYEKKSLVKLTIPSTVKVVQKHEFWGCTHLKELIIHNGLSEIQDNAFRECSSLTKIHLPGSITSIGNRAFFYCESLESVHLPTSVQTIGPAAFASCPNLDTTTIQRINDLVTKQPRQNITLTQGPGPRHNFKGALQRNWGPEMCGISLYQIKQFLQHPLINRYTLMRDVVRLAVKPATKHCGVGYALLLNQDKPLHANIMVSHAWDEPIGQFITCLERSGHEGPFWVCAFSIYQSDGDGDSPTIGEQLGDDPEYGPFSTVLKGANSMIAVVTEECDIYTRLWCVYELYIAQTLNKKVQLCPHMDDGFIKRGWLTMDICILKIDTAIDSKSALCSNENDKWSIYQAIMSSSSNDGFQNINMSVEKLRLDYLLTYPVEDITHTQDDYDTNNGNIQTPKKTAVELLASKVTLVIPRIHSCDEKIIPCFQNYESDPISAYKKWARDVQYFLERSSENDINAQEITTMDTATGTESTSSCNIA